MADEERLAGVLGLAAPLQAAVQAAVQGAPTAEALEAAAASSYALLEGLAREHAAQVGLDLRRRRLLRLQPHLLLRRRDDARGSATTVRPPRPQKMSPPRPRATPPAAAAAPPDEPPGGLAGSHGFLVMPVSGLSVTPFQPNSGVVVLPRRTAPCSLKRATSGASFSHEPSSIVVNDPLLVDQPLVSTRSLIVVGMPSVRPQGLLLTQRSSDFLASARAFSGSTIRKALNTGLNFSILAKTASVASTGDSVLF